MIVAVLPTGFSLYVPASFSFILIYVIIIYCFGAIINAECKRQRGGSVLEMKVTAPLTTIPIHSH